MAFDYAKSKATAERLIANFGQSATLTQVVKGGDEWAPTLTPTETTITVVDLNERLRDASGTLVGGSSRSLLISTSAGVTPTKDDKITISGIDHVLAEVRPLAPGGTVLLWEADLAI